MKIIKLKTLIARGEANNGITTTKLKEMLKTFKCDRNENVEKFLKNNAMMMQKSNIANTYLFLNGSCNQITAFFTLISKDIDISGYSLSATQMKKYTGSSDPKNFKVTSVHICQLAKNDLATKPLQGHHLWQGIYEVLSFWESPFRLISLDCKPEMFEYYGRKNFKEVGYVNAIERHTMIKKRDVEATMANFQDNTQTLAK